MAVLNLIFYRKSLNLTRRCMSSIRQIDKLLIANRGEIACRVMKTAKRLGIQTVTVYSDADKSSMHVAMADESFHIGPAASQQSYLCSDKILAVAKKAQCQAIHPGYGFLSENLEFAEQCQQEGLIFVGPPASAIRDMGIKSTSKMIMSSAGVPIIEGYHGEDQTVDKLCSEAKRIGFPIMIKAVRGGGGKGMRIAETEQEFLSALESAKNESLKAFGDDNVLLEKYISEPRHVEVQIFADSHGNAVYLFERDCSVQRRHQKIIEEAPAPGITPELRKELGEAAVRAAKAVNYIGAGTVEFILDRHTHSFHFMEMNTRLQVEHPITEMITGTDLVEWQLKIASGKSLPVMQNQISLNGHAFEARIYAEDPNNGFLPRSGPLIHLSTPTPSEDVRIETGVREGDEVSVHYDPMIAKLVVWGNDRIEALAKLRSGLAEYNIAGIETNVNFLLDLTKHTEFVKGNVHTGFIDEHMKSLFPEKSCTEIDKAKAALASVLYDQMLTLQSASNIGAVNNPFLIEMGFRVNHDHIKIFKFIHNEKDEVTAKIKIVEPNKYEICLNNNDEWKPISGKICQNNNKLEMEYNFDDHYGKCNVVVIEENMYIFDKNGQTKFTTDLPKYIKDLGQDAFSANMDAAVSPLPGILEKLNVSVGDDIKEGEPLFVIIAMKMEHIVKAPRNAKISQINFKVGEYVSKNGVIVQFEKISSE